jgi:hypothetical protein
MPHYNLQARLWIRRLLLFVAIGAALYALVLAFIRLTTHQYPGLAPDPVSYTTLTEIKPSTPNLKLILQPFPNHLTMDAASTATQQFTTSLQLENDGDQAAAFDATITASSSCLVPTISNLPSIVPAHQALPLTFSLAAQNCIHASLPQQLLLSLNYTWSLQKLPGHRRAAAPEPQDAGRLQLPPGQSKDAPLTLNLSIHLPNNRQPSRLTPGQPPRTFAGLVTFSPIEVSTARERSVRHFYAIADSIAKDFTWPVLLAFLAYITQVGLARRGERQQIFNAMLPILTKLILEHYVPMARRMQTVATEAEKIKASNPIPTPASNLPLRRTFSTILLMRRRVQHLFNSNGGIFFRSAVGEELFDLCLSGFYRNFQIITGDDDACETLALALSPKDTPVRAQTRIFSTRWSPISTPLYDKFAAWAIDASGARSAEFDSYLLQLFLAEAVISFECNRIYYQTTAHAEHSEQNWYFDSPAFYFEGDLSQLPHSDKKAKASTARILKLYTQYLNGLPSECFGKAKYP